VYYNCVKFHKNPISGLGGVALTWYMDGRTDGRTGWFLHTLPNFVCGGYNNYTAVVRRTVETRLKYAILFRLWICWDRISGIIVRVLVSSVVDHVFEPRADKTKDYAIGICCFSTKHASLRRKSKDWLARNQDNMSEWSDMSIRELLFQRASNINKSN
jgi:hypothetical protein